MYERQPDAAELAASGLTLEDFAGSAAEIWPENLIVFRLFQDVQTQWRAAGMGLIGLDYNVVFAKMGRMGLTPDEYDDLEDDVREMEFAALAAMNEKND